MKNIHFIINTLSPNAIKAKNQIIAYFNKSIPETSIKLSKYKGHSIELTCASILEGAEIIVACGGDGTVNEVARCLVNTSVKMAVLPIGSGNGLARHLKIPISICPALELLNRCEFKKMDVGKANEHYFFCNVSVAFSAQVIDCYDQIPQRGFYAYTKAFVKAVSSFKYISFDLEERNNQMKSTPFILMFSNTDQLGYNKSFTPNASLFDGKLDMVRLEKTNLIKISMFLFFALFKKYPAFTHLDRNRVDQIKLQSGKDFKIQLDGESVKLNTNVLNIKILPKSLKVIC